MSVWIFRDADAITGLNTQTFCEGKRPCEKRWKKTRKGGAGAAPLTVSHQAEEEEVERVQVSTAWQPEEDSAKNRGLQSEADVPEALCILDTGLSYYC